MEPIYLETKDLKKELGHGTDGVVYIYNSAYLVKLYYRYMRNILEKQKFLNEEMKIYTKGSLKNYDVKEPLNYFSYCEEEIRIRPKEAIFLSIKRQEEIKRSLLPQNAVYLEGKFSGCLLKKVRGIPIHKWTGLSYALKKTIMIEVLKDVEELLNHNIYPIDLANSPFAINCYEKNGNFYFEKGHSHILVDPFTLKTHLIDLDGKSTIYTEKKNEHYEEEALKSLNILFIEFLYSLSLNEYETEDELLSVLDSFKIPYYYQKGLANENLRIPELKELLKQKICKRN